MTKLYRCFDTDEETPVQFVGVHPLRWRPAWGEPTAMFREAEDAEIAQLPEVRELVAAAKNILYDLGEPATWKDVCPTHHKQLIAALAPFEEPEKCEPKPS